MDNYKLTIIIICIILCIPAIIIDIKASMYFRIITNRIIILLGITVILCLIIAKNYSAVIIGIGWLIGSLIGTAFSDKMSCPRCGKRYGFMVWFSDRCPHCHTKFKEMRKK